MVQSAYVLCRLFRKSEEKAEVVNYDDVELTTSPIVKSSPEDTSSDLVQETAALDMQINRQSESIRHWLTDRLDDISSNSHLPVESCSNNYLTSDVEDHGMEGLPYEAGFLFPLQLWNLPQSMGLIGTLFSTKFRDAHYLGTMLLVLHMI